MVEAPDVPRSPSAQRLSRDGSRGAGGRLHAMPSDDMSHEPPSHLVSPLRDGELEAFFDLDAAAFGMRMPVGFEALVRKSIRFDRVAASRDGGSLVASAVSEPTLMTVPGLARCRTALVVGVAVLPTHRRQGRLRSLMRYQLDDLRGRGEAMAVLFASEGGIYGRFGYGPATFASSYSIDKRVASLAASSAELVAGGVHLVQREQAAEAFASVYTAYAPRRAGEVDRGEIDFHHALGEVGSEELSRRFYAVYEEAGRLDGYVAYETAPSPPPPEGARRLEVHELCSLTPAAYAALWDFLLGVDLTPELLAEHRPVDEPLRWMLSEPRQLRCGFTGDRTWVRLVDVASCLAGRRYALAGDLVIGVHDEFCPWNSGRYRIVATEDWCEPEVSRTDAEPDLEMAASTLASLYLGGVSVRALAEVGHVRAKSSAAVTRGNRMFANDRPPYSLTHF